MNKIKLLVIFTFWLLYFCSCKNKKTEATFIFSEYVNSDSIETRNSYPDSLTFKSGYGVRLFYDNKHNLQRLGGKVLGKYYGHFFKMNAGKQSNKEISYGKLISYLYETFNGQPYFIKYEEKTKLYVEKGSPCVDFFVFYNELDTTIRYTFHFSTFPRRDITASFSLDGKNYFKFNLYKSDFMPFLEEAQIHINKKFEKISIKTHAKSLRFKYQNFKDDKAFMDTIQLFNKIKNKDSKF